MSGVTGGLTLCQPRSRFSWVGPQVEEDVEGAIQLCDFFIFILFYFKP